MLSPTLISDRVVTSATFWRVRGSADRICSSCVSPREKEGVSMK